VPPPVKHKPAQNVKGRIRQLENLVVDLMNQNQRQVQKLPNGQSERRATIDSNASTGPPYSQPTPPSDLDNSPQDSEQSQQSRESVEDVDSATAPFGQMKISKNEISYVGESHWGAILNSISDLKRDIGEEDEEDDPADSPEQTVNSWESVPIGGVQPHSSTGLGFMLGDGNRSVTREELIQSVPEKRKADRLLSLWFNSPDPFRPIIHAPTFQDEYKRFWKTPDETPTMWFGLLYAILSLAASFGLRDNDPRSSEAQAILADVNKYHSLSASAAVLADFTKPKSYTLECLILYSAGLRSNNAFVNVWLMVGLIVRLALRMGYHRDSCHYRAISAFQGEMRRRVWSVIGMIDVLISFQLGLPSMFRNIVSDTQAPRNLLDRDFNSTTKVLPPGRGIEELTPSSYTRAKLRIVKVFANAAELSHQTIAPSYEEVLRLDGELEEAKAAVPPLLQMPDISELVTDPAEQLMCRFNLDLLYLKTKIVLHRRFMLVPVSQLSALEQQRGIGNSRLACIGAALRVLNHHHTIYSASQNGGQLESVKWYMGSISTHDFLLASMIICLELNEQINDRSFRYSPAGLACPKRRAMMDALEKSQQIWGDASERKRKRMTATNPHEIEKGEHMFDETEKASRAMGVMLDRVKRQMADTPGPLGEFDATSYVRTDPQAFEETPFTGVISQHQWSGMDGVPNDLTLGNGESFNWGANNEMLASDPNWPINPADLNAQPLVNGSNEQVPQQQDFSMISGLLDGSMRMNIDWESW
jgi:hypothetical protein